MRKLTILMAYFSSYSILGKGSADKMEKVELDKDTAETFQGGNNGGSSGGGGASSGGGGSGASFTELGLQAHNMFRKIHGTPAMKLDAEMSKGAEEYAKKLADMGTLQHAKTDYGENLAMKCSSKENDLMTAQEATKNWYVLNFVAIFNFCFQHS